MQTDIARLHDIWKEMYEQGLVYDKKLFQGINDAFHEADRRVGAHDIFYQFGMGTPNQALRAIRDEIIDQSRIRIDKDSANSLVEQINSVINSHPSWEMSPSEWRRRSADTEEVSGKKLEDAFHGMLVFNPEIARRIGAPLPPDPNKGCQPTTLTLIFLFVASVVFLRSVLNK